MNKKIIFSLLEILLLTANINTVFAYYGTDYTDVYAVEGGNLYFDSATGTILGADEYITSADIPSEINGTAVTAIDYGAFCYCLEMKSITIPDSITDIGDRAFYRCPLNEFKVDSGNDCYCTQDGVLFTKDLTELVAYPYEKDDTVYTVPDSVETIVPGAFGYSRNLEEVILPENLTRLGSLAFEESHLCSIVIPEGVETIESLVFEECKDLTSVVLPSTITTIESGAFVYCINLNRISIPRFIEDIAEDAFYYSGLETVFCYEATAADDEQLYSVHDYNFGNSEIINTRLIYLDYFNFNEALGKITKYNGNETDLIIPDIINGIKVESIGSYAFQSLTSITIYENITEIDEYAFSDCSSLDHVYCYKGFAADNASLYVSPVTFVYIDFVFDDSTGTITDYIGYLTNVDIPGEIDGITVVEIGTYAFNYCSDITSIVIPTEIKTINNCAFLNCSSLKTVYYRGSEDEWNDMDISSGGNEYLLNADIVYLYQDDSECNITISTENVLGGVELTLSGDNVRTIYYTTDGTVPTTKSKVYEKPFTLTEAGSYVIEAMAYDGTAYGDIETKSIELSQVSKPSISCSNGVVTITAEDGADIYYNYSLTPPTTSSSIYSEAFTVSTSVYISAVAMKAGYAKSNTAILYCAGSEEKEDYQPLTDSYSFSNVKESFGYSIIYKIPKSSYISVFGETLGSALYNEYAYTDSGSLKFWKGSCFGMALTSMLFYANGLTPSEYCSSDYDRLYDISAPKSSDASLTKLIERCQVSQFLPIIQTEMSYEEEDGGNWVQSGFGDLSNILSAAQNCSSEPVIFYISRLKDDYVYGHAVLPYKVENSYDDPNVFYVYIYDCDIPNNEDDEENYIIIDLSENTFLYNGIDTYDYAISFVKISSLIENDTVSLLEDDDVENNASVMTDNFLFITNSNDVSIYNNSGIEVGNISGAVKYGTMGIEDSTGIMWLLPDDKYTVVNNDSSINKFKVNIVDEVDSFTLTTDNLSSEISFGRYNNRLYVSSSSENETNIAIDTYNSTKKDNSISLCSDYVYVKPYNDDIIELYTNTDTITANNIVFSLDTYSGSFVDAEYMLLVNKNAASEVEKDCEISVISKPQISSNTFSGTLKLNLINNGEVSESGTLYIALYDEEANKILAEQSQAVSSLIPGESRNITFDVDYDLSETAEEYVLKVMFWDEDMQPVSDSIELIY